MEHIYRGILFVYDRHHLEHAGFICAKSQACVVVGGSRTNGNRNVSYCFELIRDYASTLFVDSCILERSFCCRVSHILGLLALGPHLVFLSHLRDFLEEALPIMVCGGSVSYLCPPYDCFLTFI